MTWALATVCLVLIGAHFVPVARGWYRTLHRDRREECETCGAQPRRIWRITAGFDDDTEASIDGGSAVSASWCRRHAPTGAVRRVNPRR